MIIFQQNGAPAHYGYEVRGWLNEKWIDRRGAIEWVPSSPDLSLCDFFLLVHLKHNVYSSSIKNFAHLRQRIFEEIIILIETLKKVF